MTQARPLAVVTGARRGIGAAIAIELAARGFDLALTDISSEGSQGTLAEIARRGARAKLYESDLARVDEHTKLIERIVADSGPITCLVNNAGIAAAQRGDLLDVSVESFDRVLDVNLRRTFFLTQAVAKHMVGLGHVATARSIITVSSVSAEMASVDRGEYCVSKSGLGMLTKLFALRLAELGIGVYEVRPGIILTPMTEVVAARYDARIADGLVPMNRWGRPEDVARAVAALADGHMGFSTGSVIAVDGALSIPRL